MGDDIVCLLVAGRFRTDVLPVFESLLSAIKQEIISEREMLELNHPPPAGVFPNKHRTFFNHQRRKKIFYKTAGEIEENS